MAKKLVPSVSAGAQMTKNKRNKRQKTKQLQTRPNHKRSETIQIQCSPVLAEEGPKKVFFLVGTSIFYGPPKLGLFSTWPSELETGPSDVIPGLSPPFQAYLTRFYYLVTFSCICHILRRKNISASENNTHAFSEQRCPRCEQAIDGLEWRHKLC